MHMLHDNDSARQWLNTMGVNRLIVVSPHLDDAVLSIAGLLGAASARAEVLTVFTEADPQFGMAWALAAGFADAREEHAERRLEDKRAMQHLGCGHVHAGLRNGELTDETAQGLLQGLVDTDAPVPSDMLFLLPAASGGTRPYTGFQKLRNRVLRQPFGAPAHPEHEQVRDRLWQVLSSWEARVGFYADLPYAWRQSDAKIQAELESRTARPLEAIHIRADPKDKLAATWHYPSQMRLILGKSPAYQQRVLSRPECIFLVKSPSTPGAS
jgi:hypothetical protein